MNQANYKISFDQIENILKLFGLFKMKGIKTLSDAGVSEAFKTASLDEKYYSAYKIGLENFDFDFLLEDNSFFQFEYSHDKKIPKIRYSFFQNPSNFVAYKDYVAELISKHNFDESVEELGQLFEEEYNQFLDEQELISNYVTLRYDTDPVNYHPLIHSISHIHVGHLNNIRIPMNKIISPALFVLFTLKHVYYKKWKEHINKEDTFLMEYLRKSHHGELVLSDEYWQENETIELHLQ